MMIRLLTLVSMLGAMGSAWTQPFPAKPIEVVNAFAPGGANDVNMRALQPAAEKVLGQPLVQTFRQGGGGIVGITEVANSAPDGYKLAIVSSGEMTAAPNLGRASYTLDSFAYIGRISSKPYGIVVNRNAPWKTIEELLRSIREEPGKRTIGTTPNGGMFLTAQHFIRRNSVSMTTVPFGGAGPALSAVLGSHIDSVWAPIAAAEQHLRAGTLRLLAVSGTGRMKSHPDVPALRELKFDAPYVQWIGIVGPKGIPAERLGYLRSALQQIAKEPLYAETAQKIGVEIDYGSAEEFEKQVRDEDQAFKALVKDLGIKPQ